MKAEAYGISYLKRDRRYDIPFFQRGYIWDKDNWEEFYNSLVEGIKENKTAFLGSLIIKDTGRKEWDKSIYNVIDGQQRLTTISLFVKAFYDEKISNTDRNFSEYRNTLFIYENHSSDTRQPKINHSRLDKADYDAVIKENLSEDDYKITKSKIINCYKFFKEKLVNLEDVDIINKLKEYILNAEDEFYKIFVVIEINSNENEQKIFDTVNSSGVKLTSADIIKNALFERLITLSGNTTKVVGFYSDSWEKVFLRDNETLDYWSYEIVSGRIKRERIEVLLHSVAVISGIYDVQANKIEDLPDKYKSYINKLKYNEIEKLISTVCEYAELYREKFIEFTPGHQFTLNNRLELFHKIFDVLDTSTFDPYILFLYHQNSIGKLSDEVLLDKILKLEKYVVRTTICGSENKKTFNKNNADLVNFNSSVEIEHLLNRDDINDSKFRSALKRVRNNAYGRLCLFLIELNRIHKSKGNASLSSLQFTYSLEHIMPQGYKEHWGFESLPIMDENGNVILDIEKLEEIRSSAIYQIGNMTLITQPLNSKVSNNSFLIKKQGTKKGKKWLSGLKDYAQLSISLEVIQSDFWSEKEIYLRTEKLTEELLGLW